MLTALVFSGCSKSDDDNSEKIRANAKGIYLNGSENKEIEEHISKIIEISNKFNINKEEVINLFEFIYGSCEK